MLRNSKKPMVQPMDILYSDNPSKFEDYLETIHKSDISHFSVKQQLAIQQIEEGLKNYHKAFSLTQSGVIDRAESHDRKQITKVQNTVASLPFVPFTGAISSAIGAVADVAVENKQAGKEITNHAIISKMTSTDENRAKLFRLVSMAVVESMEEPLELHCVDDKAVEEFSEAAIRCLSVALVKYPLTNHESSDFGIGTPEGMQTLAQDIFSSFFRLKKGHVIISKTTAMEQFIGTPLYIMQEDGSARFLFPEKRSHIEANAGEMGFRKAHPLENLSHYNPQLKGKKDPKKTILVDHTDQVLVRNSDGSVLVPPGKKMNYLDLKTYGSSKHKRISADELKKSDVIVADKRIHEMERRKVVDRIKALKRQHKNLQNKYKFQFEKIHEYADEFKGLDNSFFSRLQALKPTYKSLEDIDYKAEYKDLIQYEGVYLKDAIQSLHKALDGLREVHIDIAFAQYKNQYPVRIKSGDHEFDAAVIEKYDDEKEKAKSALADLIARRKRHVKNYKDLFDKIKDIQPLLNKSDLKLDPKIKQQLLDAIQSDIAVEEFEDSSESLIKIETRIKRYSAVLEESEKQYKILKDYESIIDKIKADNAEARRFERKESKEEGLDTKHHNPVLVRSESKVENLSKADRKMNKPDVKSSVSSKLDVEEKLTPDEQNLKNKMVDYLKKNPRKAKVFFSLAAGAGAGLTFILAKILFPIGIGFALGKLTVAGAHAVINAVAAAVAHPAITVGTSTAVASSSYGAYSFFKSNSEAEKINILKKSILNKSFKELSQKILEGMKEEINNSKSWWKRWFSSEKEYMEEEYDILFGLRNEPANFLNKVMKMIEKNTQTDDDKKIRKCILTILSKELLGTSLKDGEENKVATRLLNLLTHLKMALPQLASERKDKKEIAINTQRLSQFESEVVELSESTPTRESKEIKPEILKAGTG